MPNWRDEYPYPITLTIAIISVVVSVGVLLTSPEYCRITVYISGIGLSCFLFEFLGWRLLFGYKTTGRFIYSVHWILFISLICIFVFILVPGLLRERERNLKLRKSMEETASIFQSHYEFVKQSEKLL